MVSPPKRCRRFAPKHQGACKTCRFRHVRCDRRKPECTACRQSNRVCEDSTSEEDEGSTPHLKIVTYKPRKPSPSQSLSSQRGTPTESRALKYFGDVLVYHLVKVFDSGFWTSTVLRLASASIPIRHAVIALSSLWEDSFDTSKKSSQQNKPETLAFRQYGLALTQTQKALESTNKPAHEELLVGSILFLCFEMFQGNLRSALCQVSIMFRIFCDWHTTPTAARLIQNSNTALEEDTTESQLIRLRSRLLLQSMVFPATHPINLSILNPAYCMPLPIIPERFRSIEEARDFFFACTGSMVHSSLSQVFQGGQRDATEESQQRPLFKLDSYILNKWRLAFHNLEISLADTIGSREKAGLDILRTQYTTMTILLNVTVKQSDLAYDDCGQSFLEIVHLAESVMHLGNATGDHSSSDLPNFDMGVLAPLYFVATRCRHPVTRRRAVDLLYQGPKREGMWEAAMLIKLANFIMSSEEDGLANVSSAEDVPESSRLRILNVYVRSAERRLEIRLVQGPGLREVRDTIIY